MIADNAIQNRWELLESVLGKNIKHSFSAYSWYEDADLRISKSEHWSGWWNSCFNFISVWSRSAKGDKLKQRIAEAFSANGYAVNTRLINGGIGISFNTMTAEESRAKAERNLLNGGRMSD